MNAQMYDVQYVAARLAARRVKAGQAKEKSPMARCYNLTSEELAELRELIAGGADEEDLGAFAQRYNVHGNVMRSYIRGIRSQLRAAEETAAAYEAEVEEEFQAAVASPPAVVVAAPPTPPAPNGLTAAPPAARIGTIIDWLTTIRAMRDELREFGVLVEGSISLRVEL